MRALARGADHPAVDGWPSGAVVVISSRGRGVRAEKAVGGALLAVAQHDELAWAVLVGDGGHGGAPGVGGREDLAPARDEDRGLVPVVRHEQQVGGPAVLRGEQHAVRRGDDGAFAGQMVRLGGGEPAGGGGAVGGHGEDAAVPGDQGAAFRSWLGGDEADGLAVGGEAGQADREGGVGDPVQAGAVRRARPHVGVVVEPAAVVAGRGEGQPRAVGLHAGSSWS
ncbi:hypothetical protein GCM10020219_069550 [Nonomuraea dietziae]